MSYFQAVRLYAGLESCVFVALLVVWLGKLDAGAKTALGWVHGWGWILLCLLVAWGFVRRIFPGPLLAATVSPAGPLGALIGFEVLARSVKSVNAATLSADVSGQRPESPDAVQDPVGPGSGRRAARGDAERVDGQRVDPGRDHLRGGSDH